MTAPHGKDAARSLARAVRDAIADPAERAHAAAAIRDRIAALDLPAGEVGGYWPLGSELDVRPALHHLRTLGRTVALPVSGPRGSALVFRRWRPEDVLVKGRYGIHEPDGSSPELRPAVLLVPLLAFDRRGHRLGYGAGYYDRTLEALRAVHPVLAVGVAFAAQELEAVPVGAHDQPLDWIVTEREALGISTEREALRTSRH
ncbi:5-formyltetrahydrofolate cyclo-ligase [Azospirillum thermophilum]|uniref:5-formyltetrahydrofolate cyclo-ligase n=1 Tax=Azospirillum thermophilum TaxID=2202148 RepID=A0A2S2CLZ3_9PROT|nr:5-formyltetrahydrofolate cyclo-ligase [Azospirillum thermophilum]AWK85533.1 5-formyltetrahydrofolate cyclo-ligase [Azospirillum thermophilum]